MEPKTNVVLVHGAWADGSSWSKVIRILQNKGFNVTAAQLPLTSLADDIAVTRNLLARQKGPTVLVGHSYGGVVISGAANHAPNVIALVYIAAFGLDEGESIESLSNQGPGPAGAAQVRPDDHGFLWIDRDGFPQAFAADVDRVEARVMAATQKPLSISSFSAKSGPPAWKRLPSCGVGRATVAIAKSLGLRTVNVVRRDEVVAEVKALGGDVVLVDGPDLAKRVGAETGNAPITLALDGVGDTSPMNLMNCLAESGVLVSYGGTGRKPMVVQPSSLIFKKQTIRGFWLLYWYRSARPDEITAMFDHLAPLIAAGTISAPVAATYGFDQVREAIAKAAQSGGKVLFTPKT
jgi:pimeloyl-ACP methyl ester carboxylesterase